MAYLNYRHCFPLHASAPVLIVLPFYCKHRTMLPIQKSQFIAQCKAYIRLNDQLTRMVENFVTQQPEYYNHYDQRMIAYENARQGYLNQYIRELHNPSVYQLNEQIEAIYLPANNEIPEEPQMMPMPFEYLHAESANPPPRDASEMVCALGVQIALLEEKAEEASQPAPASNDVISEILNLPNSPLLGDNIMEEWNLGKLFDCVSDTDSADSLVIDTDYDSEKEKVSSSFRTATKGVDQKNSGIGPEVFGKPYADFLTMERECNMQKVLCFFRQKPPMLTPDQLEEKIHKLHKYCLIHLQDSYKVHLNRLKGLQLIEEIIRRTEFQKIKPLQAMSLTWCIISCVHHFYIRLRVSRGPMDWGRRRQARRAMRAYEILLSLTLPSLFNSVTHAIVTFYNESKMWNTEYLCAELLKRVLYIGTEHESTVHAVLDTAEKTSLVDIREARQVIRVLYQVLETYQWLKMDEDLMLRFLTMYHKSIMPSIHDTFDYAPLRKGLEVCLRHVLENLPVDNLLEIIKIMLQWTFDDEVSDEALLDFGNVLEYAAMVHETYFYLDSLRVDVFPLILELIASQNRLHSLLGNRVLHQLLDRHENKVQFDSPRIFFDDIHVNISIAVYNTDDKSFMRKNREMIHSALLTSIELHGVHRINLESTYTTIALFVVEIPCGYTAAAIVCLAMAIQEYTLGDADIELECTHRLHATVMAILSLVCWVHKAEVFYDYLKTVVARRAQFAPHLNPPFRATYQYAQHHILWNKPELFFEDWEARYGLWKCFRTRRNRLSNGVHVLKAAVSEQEIM